ncbi:MAG TPA: chemotaxis protein CheW [Paludibaculum sp.]|jgi:purine-binding chemotaxis protein CheW
MAGPWDSENNRDQGQIGELPLGGLLSELLASEGVDPCEFAEFAALPASLASTNYPEKPAPALATPLLETEATITPPEALGDAPVALPGLAAQLWALNQATTTDSDTWPTPEAAEAQLECAPVPETQDFALPGLLLSLTEEAGEAEPMPEPDVTLEPAAPLEAVLVEAVEAAPEPEAVEAPESEPSIPAAVEPPIEIVEAPAEELPDIVVALPHGRANDLSNLIGAIDSELAEAPALSAGRAHELDKTHERFVCFRLGGISYGLHMRLVREVERLGRVTQVPGAPKLVCGLINLRGEILPLLDTRLLLEQEPAGWPPSGYLLVVQPDAEEPPLALLVDELGGVAIVDPASVETDLSELEGMLAKHTLGLAEHRGRVVLLLDHRNLVTHEALMASAGTGSSN